MGWLTLGRPRPPSPRRRASLGGLALTALGVAALAIGGALLVAAPALWILHSDPAPAATAAASP